MNFEEWNKVLLKPRDMSDSECAPLPIFTDGKTCVSCWKAGLMERFRVLFGGKVWLMVMSGTSQPPVAMTCEKPLNMGGKVRSDAR